MPAIKILSDKRLPNSRCPDFQSIHWNYLISKKAVKESSQVPETKNNVQNFGKIWDEKIAELSTFFQKINVNLNGWVIGNFSRKWKQNRLTSELIASGWLRH